MGIYATRRPSLRRTVAKSVAALMFGGALFLSANASATPITITNGAGTILLGFDGLNIGGNAYNFRIQDGTCADIFGPGSGGGAALQGGPCNLNAFAFHTSVDANAANLVLLAAIQATIFDHAPASIFDPAPGNSLSRVIWTPWGENPGGDPAGILTAHLSISAADTLNPSVIHANSSAGNNGVWGVFTPIPEPSTLALFGAGLAGLGAARRRRKAKA